ncbi:MULTISPECIES: siderophore-interacting protein [Streptomyces]|uniref:siderophore-interacting protein n=1 Tax=Streptomyces TaxID=1883 RepID=UPI00163D1E61|nr:MULTISPECIES: siderophore-interacting protein [Streptomyces]MBC2875435.1 siderophore-interacting protein [Streptomyces sp. TYQ1024]UBI35675.1 siderophore-interacting protein [Streptomyces mobaraensis]UKW28269.1 siderophore-interacting protein [Streptomyces sp. TYQ1024]
MRKRLPRARIETYLAPLLRATALTPRMLRLRVGGETLRGFAAGRTADERVKLFFPAPGERAPALPEIGPTGMRYPEGAAIPHARSYTVRRFDPATLELDIDFVVHGDGRAVDWARRARPGDLLGIAGPTGGWTPAPEADVHLIAGDETALPAIATMLERIPSGARALVIAEVADEDDEQYLEAPPGTEIRWVRRDRAGWRSPTPMERAVRELAWPEGVVHAWVAGEASAVRAVRRHLLHERGLERSALDASGYWRHGMTVEQWVATEGDDVNRDDAGRGDADGVAHEAVRSKV